MANKKVYSIEINGLAESVKSVGALEEKIKALQKAINSFKGKKLSVPIELGNDMNDITKQLKALKSKLKGVKGVDLPIKEEKEYVNALKARQKALDAVNKAVDESGKNLKEYKQDTKNMVAAEEMARNAAKGYANTLNGLKQELKDLNSYKGDIDLGSQEFQDISEKILDITNRLKDYEAAQGSFGRNVGNYKNSIKDAVEEMDKLNGATEKTEDSVEDIASKFERLKDVKINSENIKQYGISIDDLKWKINQLEKFISSADIGSDEWHQANEELLDLKQTLGLVENQMEAAVRAEDQLGTKIKLNINGMNLIFDDVNQAIGILEDKMYQLAAAGKQNTEEFRAIAKAASELKIQVKAVDINIDNMVEGGKGINKMLSYFKGFTGLATAGAGIGQLFGMDDAEGQKQIQTMTALIGALEGIKAIQQEMQQGTDFGKAMQKLSRAIDKVIDKLLLLNEKIFNLKDITKNTFEGFNLKDIPINERWSETFDRMLSTLPKLKDEYDVLLEKAKKFGIEGVKATELSGEIIKKQLNALRKFQEAGGTSEEFFNSDQFKELEELNKEVREFEESVVKGFEKSRTFSDGIAELKRQFKKFSSELKKNIGLSNKAGKNAVKASWGFKTLAASVKIVNAALKTLRAALKAFLIFELINIVVTLAEKVKDITISIYDWARGNDKLVNSIDTVNHSIDATTKSVDKYLANIDRLKDKGLLSELDATSKKYEYLSLKIKDVAKELKDYIKLRGESKKLEDNLSDDGLTRADDIENIKAFKKEYEDLQKAVAAGVSIRDVAGGKWTDFWFTASDAKSDLAVMQKRVIEDIQDKINNLDLSKGTSEIKKFLDTLDEEMYSTSLANIENLYPEEEWAKILKSRLDQVRDMYEKMTDASDEASDAQIEDLKRIEQEQINYEQKRSKSIRDNLTAAIADDYKRQMEELKNQRRDELDSAEGDLSVIKSINAKYNRLEADARDAHNKEMESKRKSEADKAKSAQEKLNDALKRLRDLALENEEESLDKRIQILKNQMQDELDAAKENGNLVNELRLEIEKKYNKLIEKERQNHLDYLNDLAEDYARKQLELEQQIKEDALNNQKERVDIEYNIKSNTSQGSFDFDAQYGARIEQEKLFNEKRLQLELEYLQEKVQIDRANAQLEAENNRISEEQRFADAQDTLDKAHRDGLLSEKEYNENIQKEKKLHSGYMQQIQVNLNNELINIDDNYYNERKEKLSQALTDNVALYSQYSNDISNIMGSVGTKLNMFGVIDISATKKDLDKAKNLVKQGLDGIKQERDNLDKKLKSGEITFVDYKDARQQLKETENTIKSQGKDITTAMSDLLKNVASQWMSMVTSWVGAVSSLLSTMNDTQMTLIENEMAQVDHQLEIQEEAYQKAEEAAQKHKDKMDGIEDELKDARGARRQFLIDTLAAQQSAYLEEIKAQQEAEKEKEKLAKQKEALEKRRKEQDKKAKVQQAIINTFTAVSNALAVSPWFVGLALSTVALGLGMKNVAAIKSTPIYEDGGVIQGKRHRDGGVKVLGGQAEVEGGEFITNRKSTAANLPLLTLINDKKRPLTPEDLVKFFNSNQGKIKNRSYSRFEEGGQLPAYNDNVDRIVQVMNANEDNKQYVVQVVDIVNEMNNLNKVKTLSGLANE